MHVKQIVKLEPQSRHGIIHAQQLGGIVDLDQGQVAVEFKHTHLKHANDGKPLQARQNAGGCRGQLRRDDRNLVTDHDP